MVSSVRKVWKLSAIPVVAVEAVLLLVAMFHSSSALGSAYGIAVTGTMLVDATMGFLVIWKHWHWSPLAAAALMAPFQAINLTFFAANLPA